MNRAIELTTHFATSDYAAGTLLDCSERGLRVFTRRLLWKGERVTIHWGQRRLPGTVVYSQSAHNGVIAGIKLSAYVQSRMIDHGLRAAGHSTGTPWCA